MIEEPEEEVAPRRKRGYHEKEPSLVVGIGASAGGIDALRAFFSRVPDKSGIAYVVILHLSPEFESRLAEVLQATAAIPVTQVQKPVRIEADHVYVISPNQMLEVKDGTLDVAQMTHAADRRAPVDRFFRTLAESYHTACAAVVLSGTGPNGSSGLKRVKELGGLTIAQDPAEAEFVDMPTNSIRTGLVDDILPVAQIPARIIDYARRVAGSPLQPLVDRSGADIENINLDDAVAMGQMRVAPDWRDVLTLLRVRTGHDFSNYKAATIHRRVERRMNVRGTSTLTEYAELMRSDPTEPLLLMKELRGIL